MIFVTVGTNEARFDRLVRAAEPLAATEELVVQHGPSPVRPQGATCVDYLPFEELTDLVRRARIVVMHAGVGSIITALSNGARPVTVPRLRRFGEAVDDHQLTFVRRLHAEGLVELVEDPAELPDVCARHDGSFGGALGAAEQLVAELREFIRGSVDRA
jgi:beta-1,4-N-acetylglucosaminyltransferase